MEIPLRMTIEAKAEHTTVYLERSSGREDGYTYVADYVDGKWRCVSLDGGGVSHELLGILRLLVEAGLVDTEEVEGDAKLARWLRGQAVLPAVKEEKKVKACAHCGGRGKITIGGSLPLTTEHPCPHCGGTGVVAIEQNESGGLG